MTEPSLSASQSSPRQRFEVGQSVQITAAPPFVKSADPMPMLRSGSLVSVGDVGRVVMIKPLGTYGIQFASGTFLIDARYLGSSESGTHSS